jgi:hypothetical protein
MDRLEVEAGRNNCYFLQQELTFLQLHRAHSGTLPDVGFDMARPCEMWNAVSDPPSRTDARGSFCVEVSFLLQAAPCVLLVCPMLN